ncbi:MAG: 3-deoxy-D-manno-octulosonic acid kinase [Gammaproteobacteria bacterium]
MKQTTDSTPALRESRRAAKDGEILFDPAVAPDFREELFALDYWRSRDALSVATGGRGTVFFARAGAQDWALRHYCRGGAVGRLLDDHYLWLGPDRTRSFREWRLLARLFSAGLPVPRPVAARYQRHGLAYTADLCTLRIPEAEPLSRRLAADTAPADIWARVGACVRKFHDAGVFHADLTAHNLLVDASGDVYLLDFDRGRLRGEGGDWRQANLARLDRSLRKIGRENPRIDVTADDMASLRRAYARGHS